VIRQINKVILEAKVFNLFSGAGMNGKDNRDFSGYFF
jgi:hypothetical protein